jgi:hypothetical protein
MVRRRNQQREPIAPAEDEVVLKNTCAHSGPRPPNVRPHKLEYAGRAAARICRYLNSMPQPAGAELLDGFASRSRAKPAGSQSAGITWFDVDPPSGVNVPLKGRPVGAMAEYELQYSDDEHADLDGDEVKASGKTLQPYRTVFDARTPRRLARENATEAVGPPQPQPQQRPTLSDTSTRTNASPALGHHLGPSTISTRQRHVLHPRVAVPPLDLVNKSGPVQRAKPTRAPDMQAADDDDGGGGGGGGGGALHATAHTHTWAAGPASVDTADTNLSSPAPPDVAPVVDLDH